ncbi:MAG: DNA mismatch repair endonuclease MutL [Fibrobacterota bacterium]
MNKIHILEDRVVEHIAAGEVIERPASVVKELVENSIDAGATKIDISVEEGGLALIRVSDNGDGIARDDLARALRRHATSKIRSEKDLFSISTMGFRGEALASISTVCRFSLSSSNVGDGLGWQLTSEGGVISGEPQPVEHLQGTTIECRDMFFNTPARRKFLKTVRGETMAVTKTIEQILLSFPGIHFRAHINGRKRYDIPAVNTPLLRIAQIGGTELADDLIHCHAHREGMSADIFINSPANVQSRPRYQSLFVNLRRINNAGVSHAVRESYSTFISGHLKPNWFCYLDIDPDRIDVNVHPTKAEIKFDNQREIFSFIYHAVQEGVGTSLRESYSENVPPPVDSVNDQGQAGTSAPLATVREDSRTLLHSFPDPQNPHPNTGEPTSTPRILKKRNSAQNSGETQTRMNFISADDSGRGSYSPDQGVTGTIPCYQIHKRYIISPVREGMILIDQHAAHERVLYEKVMKELDAGGTDSQQLLFPVTLSLTPHEKDLLLEIRNLFEQTGFEVKDFGGNSVAVSAVPARGFVKSTQVKDALQEMLTAYQEESDHSLLSSVHKRFAASYACGAAIKFGRELREEEMSSLMNSLFACKNPHICPHGRPTITKISLDELKKRFLR